MAGRIPLPTRVHELNGNPSKLDLEARKSTEPQPAVAIPAAPAHLDADAAAEWRRMSAELESLGLLTQIDRAALALYCSAWGRLVQAERELKRSGLVVTTKSGYQQKSAWLTIADTAWTQVLKACAEFGLSPASRSRVTAQPKEDTTDDAEFFDA